MTAGAFVTPTVAPVGRARTSRTSRVAMPTTATTALAFAAAVDSTTMVSLGPINLSGLLVLGLMAALLVAAPLVSGRSFRALPLALIAFGGYATVRLIAAPSADGLQNLAVLVVFLLAIPFGARQAGEETAGKVVRSFATTGVVVSLVFLVSELTGLGVYQPRSFGLTALVLLSAAVAVPATGRWTRLAPFVIVGAVVYGLSRTASALSLALLIGLVVRLRRGKRLVIAVVGFVLAAASAIALVMTYAPLRNRFLQGDNAVQFGGVSINTSGRSAIWDAMLRSFAENPVFGKGPGSSVELVTARFAAVTQPHNEYLRILHDYGVVGIVLFGIGVLALLVRIVARAARTDHPVHWAAAFALAAVLAAAITDNVLIYPFVMLPLAVLVGLSLGAPLPTEQRRPRRARTKGSRS